MSSQPGGGVGVGPMSPRRVRGRRESKVAYRNQPGYSSRNNNAPAYPSSPEQPFHRSNNNNEHGHHQLHGQAPNNLDFLGYFDVHRSSNGYSNSNPVVLQNFSDDTSWLSLSSPNSYTLATSNLPNSPQQQNYGGNHGRSPGSEVPQVSGNGQEPSWTVTTPRTSNMDSEMDDMSDFQIESFGSLDTNSMVFSTANTATSSISDTYVFPINPQFDSSGNQLHGLELPGKRLEFLLILTIR